MNDKPVNAPSVNDKVDKSLQFRTYLAPKYWGLWFTIGLLRFFTYLPTSVIRQCGSALGMLIYYLIPSRRRVAHINIKQAFPNYNKQQVDDLNKKAFKNMGISIFEMGTAWFANSDDLKKQCEIEGKEHLDQAIAENKGIILLTGHFTTLEIGGRLISFYVNKYNAVFKKSRNPLFNALVVHYRSKMGDELIETKNGRAIIRGLKNGHATWFAPDQDYHRQDIVFTPFLGGIASTLTATAKMARMANATVVPFYQKRLTGGKGFKLVILPALKDFPTKNIEADSARINKTIEDMVYACPEQYLWAHKRFKTQPDRSSNFYAQ